MIKKLKQRIFLIVMLSLSIVMLGIIILYAYLNYTNTITTTVSMMNRFIEPEPRRNHNEIEDFKIQEEELTEVRWFSFDELNEMVEEKILNQDQVDFFLKCKKYLNK